MMYTFVTPIYRQILGRMLRPFTNFNAEQRDVLSVGPAKVMLFTSNRMRALHGLDAVCLFLVSHYLLRPMMALREWIRPRAAAGEFMATMAEPMAHDLMLGLFSIPGVRWSLALVMQGRNGEATRVLAARVIRTEHEACMAGYRAAIGGPMPALVRGRSALQRVFGMALALGASR